MARDRRDIEVLLALFIILLAYAFFCGCTRISHISPGGAKTTYTNFIQNRNINLVYDPTSGVMTGNVTTGNDPVIEALKKIP